MSDEAKLKALKDPSNLATILAALELFQQQYDEQDGKAIAKDWPEHFKDETVYGAGDFELSIFPEPLGTDDIDILCAILKGD